MADIQEFSEELFPGKAEEYKSIFAQEFIAKGKAIGVWTLDKRVPPLLFFGVCWFKKHGNLVGLKV